MLVQLACDLSGAKRSFPTGYGHSGIDPLFEEYRATTEGELRQIR